MPGAFIPPSTCGDAFFGLLLPVCPVSSPCFGISGPKQGELSGAGAMLLGGSCLLLVIKPCDLFVSLFSGLCLQ